MGLFNSIFGDNSKKVLRNDYKSETVFFEKNRQHLLRLSTELFSLRKTQLRHLLSLAKEIGNITHVPVLFTSDFQSSIDNIGDFKIAVDYEHSPIEFAELTDKTGRTAKNLSRRVDSSKSKLKLSPQETMAIATVVSTVSTGTKGAAITGLAATNAALSWIFGGVTAAGGLALAHGALLLGLLAGPLGLGAMAVAAFVKSNDDQQELENQIETIRAENKIMCAKLIHLKDLIQRCDNYFKFEFLPSENWLRSVSPKDYSQWDKDQKRKFEQLINAVSNTVQLINERV